MKSFFIVLSLLLLLFHPSAFAQKVIKVDASSFRAGTANLPALAADGDNQTRWESEWQDGQWIQFELDKSMELYGISVRWETASARVYDVEVSQDGKSWTKAASVEDGWEGELRKINFTKPSICRFIKLECLERNGAWGFSIFDVGFKTDGSYPDSATGGFFIKGDKFFTVKNNGKFFWFADPDGKITIIKAVNVVLPADGAVKDGDQGYNALNKFKSKEDWAKDAIDRLKRWGFNAIGCWSDMDLFKYDMPFTMILSVPTGGPHRLVDVFDHQFEALAENTVRSKCKKFKEAKYLIGYFIDNELPWYGDWGWFTGHVSFLLDEYMKLPAEAPGKIEVISFFKKRYQSVKDFNRTWEMRLSTFDELKSLSELPGGTSEKADKDRTGFAGIVAERYFSVVTKAIRQVDSNHLILGVRFAGDAPEGVVRACGKYCDIISLNYYVRNAVLDADKLNDMHIAGGRKPLMITEFSYRAMQNNSGDMNSMGADVTVPTQNDRAVGYQKYISQLMNFPYMVGYNWFQYFDEPAKGRSFDGENSNYGILDVHDQEYRILTAKMKEMNEIAEKMHQDSTYTNFSTNMSGTEGYAVVDNRDVKRRTGALLLDMAKAKNSDVAKYGDFDKGASIALRFVEAKAHRFNMLVDLKANGWGTGMTLPVTLDPMNQDRSADLQGYKGIKIKLEAPANTKFSLFLNESGVGAPEAAEHEGVLGADGETFGSPVKRGKGAQAEYSFDFSKLAYRTVWGNQSGNRKINLQAIKSFDLFFLPGSIGTVKITEISLY